MPNGTARRLLGLASPFVALGLALCSDTPTGPEQLTSGTFHASITGDAVADRNLYGTSRDAVAQVDTTRQGAPLFRHELVLEDRDSGLRVEIVFLNPAGATGTREVVAAGDSVPEGETPPATATLDPGSLGPAAAAVTGGRLTITDSSREELAGRLRIRAAPASGDSAVQRRLHLSAEFRTPRR